MSVKRKREASLFSAKVYQVHDYTCTSLCIVIQSPTLFEARLNQQYRNNRSDSHSCLLLSYCTHCKNDNTWNIFLRQDFFILTPTKIIAFKKFTCMQIVICVHFSTVKNFGLFQPVYRVVWVAHTYVGIKLKYHWEICWTNYT